MIQPRSLRTTPLALAPALALLLLAAVLPGCSDGEGTIFTITSVPGADGAYPTMVYQTRAHGWDETGQRSFTAYVDIHGEHSDEFLPRGVYSKNVLFRIYTFDGPPWPIEDVELRSTQRATTSLASAFTLETGQAQLPDPVTGATKKAEYFACGVNGGTLMAISANQLITIKNGPAEVELTFDQLQGIAKYLDRITKPPQ